MLPIKESALATENTIIKWNYTENKDKLSEGAKRLNTIKEKHSQTDKYTDILTLIHT